MYDMVNFNYIGVDPKYGVTYGKRMVIDVAGVIGKIMHSVDGEDGQSAEQEEDETKANGKARTYLEAVKQY